jgi:DNA-damage-inducible protein D
MKDKELTSFEGKPTIFEQIKEVDENGNEYWTARKLSEILDYSDFRNFIAVIGKAKEACKNSEQNIENHFVDFNEMVLIGSGAKRIIENFKLSRYACYLIVQNADPSKEVVALGQTYFAIQTRLQEIQQMDEYNRLNTEKEKRLFLRNQLREHNVQLADAAKDAGVIENIDYAIFQNHGYMGLYGGLDAKGIHKMKALKKNEHILDHMGSAELAANLFRATQTEIKLRQENIQGKNNANKTHFEVGKKVRKTIQELGNPMPETLPTEESIKNLEKEKDKQNKAKLKTGKSNELPFDDEPKKEY